MDRFGVYLNHSGSDVSKANKLVEYARAIELGRAVARDIGGADPERMAPPRVAEYVEHLFGNSSTIKVRERCISSSSVASSSIHSDGNRQGHEDFL